MSDSDNVYKTHKPKVGDGLYLTFENNVAEKVRVVSDPACYISTFEDPNTHEVSERMLYAWLVYNFETKKIQVMKLPTKAYREIAKYAANDEYGDPRQYNLTITRTGKGFQTTYDIVPSPEKKAIPTEIAAAAAQVNLLEKLAAGNGVSNVQWLRDAAANEPGSSEEEVPSNVDVAKDPSETEEDADW